MVSATFSTLFRVSFAAVTILDAVATLSAILAAAVPSKTGMPCPLTTGIMVAEANAPVQMPRMAIIILVFMSVYFAKQTVFEKKQSRCFNQV